MPNVVIFPFTTTKQHAHVSALQNVRDRMQQIFAELDLVHTALSEHAMQAVVRENPKASEVASFARNEAAIDRLANAEFKMTGRAVRCRSDRDR